MVNVYALVPFRESVRKQQESTALLLSEWDNPLAIDETPADFKDNPRLLSRLLSGPHDIAPGGSLFLEVVSGGQTWSDSAPIRHAAPQFTGSLFAQALTPRHGGSADNPCDIRIASRKLPKEAQSGYLQLLNLLVGWSCYVDQVHLHIVAESPPPEFFVPLAKREQQERRAGEPCYFSLGHSLCAKYCEALAPTGGADAFQEEAIERVNIGEIARRRTLVFH